MAVVDPTRFRSVRLGGLDKSDEQIPRETLLSLVDQAA
jgi:hypothetical protein